MRSSLFLLAAAVVGCSSGEGNKPPPGEPSPPSKPVTSCTVSKDVGLGTGEASSPSIAADRNQVAVTWTDADGAHIRIVDKDGTTIHEEAIDKDSTAKKVSPAITTLANGGYLVTWEDLAATGGTVRAQRYDDGGLPVGKVLTLGTTGSAEARPEATATKDGSLVTWTDASGGVVAEVKKDAVVGQIPLAGGSQPAIAGGLEGAGVVWVKGADLEYAKMGLPLRSAERSQNLRSATGKANVPRIAGGPGGKFAVVWEDTRGGADGESVYMRDISSDGKVGSEMQVSPAGGSANFPDVAWVGDRAAVVYYQFRDGPPAVYMSLVEPGKGRVGDELKITASGGAHYPRVAWAGDNRMAIAYAERGGPARLSMLTCK